MKFPYHNLNRLTAVSSTLTALSLGVFASRAAVTLNASDTFVVSTPATGDLKVIGDVSVWKGLDIGVAASNSSLSAIQIDYYNVSPNLKTASFDLTDATSSFQWRDNIGTPRKKMKLDGNNVLTLYSSNGVNPNIIMDGSAGAISATGELNAGSLNLNDYTSIRANVFGGYTNNADTVAMTGGGAYDSHATAMSQGSAFGTYSTAMSSGSAYSQFATAMSYGYAYGDCSTAMSLGGAYGFSSTAMSGGSAESYYSVGMSYGNAMGYASTAMSGGYADGEYTTALSNGGAYGYSSAGMSGGTAYDEYATGMSQGYASGAFSTGMSGGSASGDYDTAMSQGQASGGNSTAMSGGNASGAYSFAAGYAAVAASYSSASLGRFSKSWGSPVTWTDLDPLLLVGNGTGAGSTQTSNAISTLKNGQTTLTNKAWKANPAVAPVAANSNGEALVVEGHARLAGNTILEGKVVISIPQGDISMGAYGN
jgi:hypothetical protein